MFPSRNPADKAIGAITTNIPHEASRDNQPTPRAQGIKPTTHQPRRTTDILTTCTPDKALRGNSPVPGVQRVMPTTRQSANPPELTRLPARSTDTLRKAHRTTRPTPGAQKATPTKHQSTNPPGLARVPTRHQPVDTPGASGSEFKFAEVFTPKNPPGPKCRLCKQRFYDVPDESRKLCLQCSESFESTRNGRGGTSGMTLRNLEHL